MDSIDAMRTVVAAILGIIAALLFSGYLPLSGSLAVGVAAYVAVRRGFDTVEYGVHGLLLVFVVMSIAAAVAGVPPTAPLAEAVAVLVVSVGLVFVYETLLRVGVAAAAGGFEEASTRDWWSVPGTIVGIIAAINGRLGTKGYEASVLAGFGVGFALLHVLLAATVQNPGLTAPVTLAAAACLGGAVLAATPRSQFDDSLRGSLIMAVVRPIWRLVAAVKVTRQQNLDRDDSGGQSSGPARTTTDGGPATSPEGATRQASNASESDTDSSTGSGLFNGLRSTIDPSFPSSVTDDSTLDPESTTENRTHDNPSPWPDDGKTTADDTTDRETVNETADTAVDPTAQTPGNATEAETGTNSSGPGTNDTSTTGATPSDDPGQCENCGRDGPNVAVRNIVEDPPVESVGNEIVLCAPCQYARVNDDPNRCRSGLPVDRGRVLDNADGVCACCGVTVDLELHAVVPIDSRGHPHEHNVVALCSTCHTAAHD